MGAPPMAVEGKQEANFGAPYMSALAARIKELNPKLLLVEIAKIILQTADDQGDPGPDNVYGIGLVNPKKAIGL